MERKIEKNIPIPEWGARGENIRFLEKMEIGDSFVIEKKTQRSAYANSAKQIGIKLTSRTLDNRTLRLWRIK